MEDIANGVMEERKRYAPIIRTINGTVVLGPYDAYQVALQARRRFIKRHKGITLSDEEINMLRMATSG